LLRQMKAALRSLPTYWPDSIALLQPATCSLHGTSAVPVHLSLSRAGVWACATPASSASTNGKAVRVDRMNMVCAALCFMRLLCRDDAVARSRAGRGVVASESMTRGPQSD
jgi:hypothetical protein